MSALAGIGLLLDAAGVGAWTAPDVLLPTDETPVTAGDMPAEGDQAVCLNTYPGGPEPDSRNGWEYPRLQVRVRATSPLDALALDAECFTVLQAASTTLPDGRLLQDCYALQSEAQPLGADANGRHEYVRNYQLSIEPAS